MTLTLTRRNYFNCFGTRNWYLLIYKLFITLAIPFEPRLFVYGLDVHFFGAFALCIKVGEWSPLHDKILVNLRFTNARLHSGL